MMRSLLLLAVLAVGGCTEVPTGPDRSNPFDPAFDGSRRVSAPTDVRLVETGDLDLTLAWTDSSSFEAGFRIERAAPSSDPRFVAVGVVGPDVTTFRQAEPVNVEGWLYRVVGLGSGRDRDSAPSESLHLRVPSRVTVSPGQGVDVVRYLSMFSPDASTLYLGVFPYESERSIRAIDAATGRVLWNVPGVIHPIRQLPGGELVGVADGTSTTPLRLSIISPTGSVLRTMVRAFQRECSVAGVDDAATRAVVTCDPGRFFLWSLTDGQVTEIEGPWSKALALSPDGQTALLRDYSENVQAYHIDQRRVLWQAPRCFGTAAEYSADGSLVFAHGCDTDSQLYRAQTGQPVPTGDARAADGFDDSGRYLYGYSGLTVSPTSTQLLLTSYRLEDGAALRSFTSNPEDLGNPDTFVVLPDGGLVAMYIAPAQTSDPDVTIVRWAPGSRWEAVTD